MMRNKFIANVRFQFLKLIYSLKTQIKTHFLKKR